MSSGPTATSSGDEELNSNSHIAVNPTRCFLLNVSGVALDTHLPEQELSDDGTSHLQMGERCSSSCNKNLNITGKSDQDCQERNSSYRQESASRSTIREENVSLLSHGEHNTSRETTPTLAFSSETSSTLSTPTESRNGWQSNQKTHEALSTNESFSINSEQEQWNADAPFSPSLLGPKRIFTESNSPYKPSDQDTEYGFDMEPRQKKLKRNNRNKNKNRKRRRKQAKLDGNTDQGSMIESTLADGTVIVDDDFYDVSSDTMSLCNSEECYQLQEASKRCSKTNFLNNFVDCISGISRRNKVNAQNQEYRPTFTFGSLLNDPTQGLIQILEDRVFPKGTPWVRHVVLYCAMLERLVKFRQEGQNRAFIFGKLFGAGLTTQEQNTTVNNTVSEGTPLANQVDRTLSNGRQDLEDSRLTIVCGFLDDVRTQPDGGQAMKANTTVAETTTQQTSTTESDRTANAKNKRRLHAKLRRKKSRFSGKCVPGIWHPTSQVYPNSSELRDGARIELIDTKDALEHKLEIADKEYRFCDWDEEVKSKVVEDPIEFAELSMNNDISYHEENPHERTNGSRYVCTNSSATIATELDEDEQKAIDKVETLRREDCHTTAFWIKFGSRICSRSCREVNSAPSLEVAMEKPPLTENGGRSEEFQRNSTDEPRITVSLKCWMQSLTNEDFKHFSLNADLQRALRVMRRPSITLGAARRVAFYGETEADSTLKIDDQ